jgi:hypothetical protein
VEGGSVAHIKPEYLLDVNEYKAWLECNNQKKELEESTGYKKISTISSEIKEIPLKLFPLVSKKAWLDCLLQLLKVSV